MEELWVIDSCGRRRRACWKVCPMCEIKFLDRISLGRTYCSVKCKHKSQETADILELICTWCKKCFSRKKSQCHSKSGMYFCGTGCKDKAAKLTGIKDIHPLHYGKATDNYRKYFDLSNSKCSRCGYCEFSVGIDIHHIDGNHCNNDICNLVMLCSPCHRALHCGLWKLGDLAEMVLASG